MSGFYHVLAVFCLLIFSSSSIFAQSDYASELQPEIEKMMKKHKITGMSVLLVDDQEVLWAEGFGFADKEKAIPADEKTVYRVGSVSKLFTAFSIMQLHEAGLLDIDAPVSDYIEEFKPKSRLGDTEPVTIRHMLTHQSGMTSDILSAFFTEDPPPFQSIVEEMNEEYLCTPPNTAWSYCNAAYSMMGVIIERISGQSFRDYCHQNLFEPMQMWTADFDLNDQNRDLYSKAYKASGDVFEEPAIRDVPAGLMHASVEDLSKFIKAVFNEGSYGRREILSPLTVDSMMRVQTPDNSLDYDLKMGLCWFRVGSGVDWSYAGNFAGHGGDTYLYHASLSLLTDQKLGAVVLTNSERGSAVATSLANKILKEALEKRKDLSPPEEEEAEAPKPAGKDPSLEAHAGLYAVGSYPVNLVYKNGKLSGKVPGSKLELVRNTAGSLNLRAKVLGFAIPIKGQVYNFDQRKGYEVLTVNNGRGTHRFGVKINELTELSPAWQARLGSYEIMGDEKDNIFLDEIKLVEKNGMLMASFKLFGSKEANFEGLDPINDTEAIVIGLGRNTGNTLMVRQKDGKEILYLQGLELIKEPD